MKIYIYLITAVFFFISCRSEDTVKLLPDPSSNYKFIFKNYNVDNLNLYKGPSGSSVSVNENYIENYWSLYKEPNWKYVEINLKEMSLNLIAGNSSDIKYPIILKNDLVFISKNNKIDYFGSFDKNRTSLTMQKYFKYIKKIPTDLSQALYISQSTDFGIATMSSVFSSSVFQSPNSMNQVGDEVFWTNITYTFTAN